MLVSLPHVESGLELGQRIGLHALHQSHEPVLDSPFPLTGRGDTLGIAVDVNTGFRLGGHGSVIVVGIQHGSFSLVF